MKKMSVLLSILGVTGTVPALACTVCRSQQPAPLRGITHDVGPSGIVDYLIIGGAVVIVVAVLVLSIKYLVRPGERNPDHIKNVILKGES
jgi:hypothetical protein